MVCRDDGLEIAHGIKFGCEIAMSKDRIYMPTKRG